MCFTHCTRRASAAFLLLLAWLSASPRCHAAVATTTFQVQITIVNACSIDSVNDLNFGSQGSIALGVDATSTFNVQCTLLVPYNIGLSAGGGAGATVTTRKLTGPGAATIDYSLYRDLTHLLVWGVSIGSDTIAGIGTGLSIPYVVYGRVAPQATPAAGTYTDTITITVTY
jgi:spore coat protein U-like protein